MRGLGGLAVLIFLPGPCVWGLAGTGINGRVPKAQGKQGKPDSPAFPGKCGCFCITAMAAGGRRGRESAAACRMIAPSQCPVPSLQGEPGPMAPKGEFPSPFLWDPLLLLERAGAWETLF